MSRRQFLFPVAASACLAFILSGCAADNGESLTDTETPTLDLTSERDLSSYRGQEVAWEECDSSWLIEAEGFSTAFSESLVECASVLVPATYLGSQDIPDFSIALMRLSPQDAEATGAIFINPGGPGGSGIEQVQYSEFPAALRDHYAFIGFDPRGVGHSDFADGSEIKCSTELDFISYFGESTPADEAEYLASIEESDQYYLDCADNNPYWWTLSTDHVVRDLDLVRDLVTPGEPLNFIGSSYGTTIAGRYVSEFPDTVGKIVFDSPTTVDTDRIQSALDDWEASERKLRGWLEGYADYADISFDNAVETLLYYRQQGDDDRLTGYAGFEDSAVDPGYAQSSEALLTNGIFALNYWPEDMAQEYFNSSMDDLVNYNWVGTLEWFAFALDGYDPDSLNGATLEDKDIIRSNEYEVRVIVNSMDYDSPELTEAEQRELSERFKEVAPIWSALYSDASGYEYFGPSLGISWNSLAREDESIPTPPTTPFIPSNPSGAQLLIVGSINESVTPYSFAQDTAKLLGSPLISVESDVHAPAAGYDNECLNNVLATYFLTDDVVDDTTCE